jgi:hypothetical protein
MTEHEQDHLIERVRTTLRDERHVAPQPQAIAKVLQTVWASPRPSFVRRALDAWRIPALSGLGASAIAAAALMIGFVSRGAVSPNTAAEPTVVSGPATGEYPVTLATNEGAERLVPTQFVFESTEAKKVSVVGEFNDWEVDELPMTRVRDGVWTTTVPLAPGRHVYAFVVDGTLLVADPRAPKSGDADYGREGSVVMVFAR